MSDIAASPIMPETPLEPDTPTAAPAQAEGEASATQARPERTRRKLDLNQNRRGAFSVLLGTLSKAKTEDKQRNASEAAQKRALLEKRLSAKLARETTSVRRAEQSKRDRVAATRREEELATKENLIRHRHSQLPNLSKFLLTSDRIDTDPSTPSAAVASLQPPRRHGNPRTAAESVIFYLPAKLLPWQEELLTKRVGLVKEGLEKEWESWVEEKKKGLEDVANLKRQAEELSKELPPVDEVEMKDAEEKEGENAS